MAVSAESLERVQRWFHAAITHPGGTREGLQSDIARQIFSDANERLDDVVLPSKALNAIERLSIYANMYFDRLIDILAEEYPTVRQLLGPREFAEVITDYVTRHPSTHYSLARLGKEFPRFLLEESDGLEEHNREFLAAVATVERTMEDVFDEQQDEPLLFEEIKSINPDSLDRIRLKTVSALRLLRLAYPVNDYIGAVRDGRIIDIPDARPSFVLIHRLNYRVWRTDLDEQQFVLLSGLHDGRTLGDALGACAELPGVDPSILETSLFKWFRNWAAEGYFHEVQLPGPV